jgi:hypothetical protein
MNIRILTKADKTIIHEVMNNYVESEKNIKNPVYSHDSVMNNFLFVNKNFFDDTEDNIILSAGIDNNIIHWLAVTAKLKYWTNNQNLLNCWYWKFLYSRSRGFKNTSVVLDEVAKPLISYYENQNFWKFYKTTKCPKKLLNNENNFIDSKYNRIFNFETYDSKIELICNSPADKLDNFASKFLPDTWRNGTSLVVMSHTKKNV